MFKLESIMVKDGFNIPLKRRIPQNHATYLSKTVTDYYKQNFMVLSNKELYLYHHKDQVNYTNLIVLTPGVFVQPLSVIHIDPSQGS